MPTVRFTDNIQRHVECPPREVPGSTVHEALNAYFAANAPATRYVLDEHGSVRPHMVIFVNGSQIRDRTTLTDPLTPACKVDVMQALSGG